MAITKFATVVGAHPRDIHTKIMRKMVFMSLIMIMLS